jgi:hypothetical protein
LYINKYRTLTVFLINTFRMTTSQKHQIYFNFKDIKIKKKYSYTFEKSKKQNLFKIITQNNPFRQNSLTNFETIFIFLHFNNRRHKHKK